MFADVERYSTNHVFMDEQYVWMNFLMKVGNKHIFCKKMNKKNKVEFFLCWFILNNLTFEMVK